MRTLVLSEEEVRLVMAYRSLTKGQQAVISDLVREMAAPEVTPESYDQAQVLPFRRA